MVQTVVAMVITPCLLLQADADYEFLKVNHLLVFIYANTVDT